MTVSFSFLLEPEPDVEKRPDIHPTINGYSVHL